MVVFISNKLNNNSTTNTLLKRGQLNRYDHSDNGSVKSEYNFIASLGVGSIKSESGVNNFGTGGQLHSEYTILSYSFKFWIDL